MTKADLVAAVLGQVGGGSRKEAAEFVETVVAVMKETLGHGEAVNVSGFGAFLTRDKMERTGRSPHTGAPITISGRRVVTFKTSVVLKELINASDRDLA